MGPVHSLLLILIRLGLRRAFVEGKEDVSAKLMLQLYRALRRKAMKRTIEMRRERDAFFIDDCELPVLALHVLVIHRYTFSRGVFLLFCNAYDLAIKASAQRKDLEAAGVRYGGPGSRVLVLPTHEGT